MRRAPLAQLSPRRSGRADEVGSFGDRGHWLQSAVPVHDDSTRRVKGDADAVS
jgi:hypothetical protein